MADTSVSMEILVETRKAAELIEKFSASASKAFGDLKNSIDNASTKAEDLGKSFQKIGNPLDALKLAAGGLLGLFAGHEIAAFFKEGIESSSKQESALSSLGAQLKLTGDFSQTALDSFKEFADELERTTGIDDDVILSQAAVAKSFGITNDQAKKLVKGAVELSASGFADLETSVKALGKTFAGTTGKLDEQIPILRTLTKEQLAHGDAVDIVLSRYGSAAEDKLDNFAGSVKKATNAFSNFREAIGDIIVTSPAIRAAIDGMTERFTELEDFVKANKASIQELAGDGITFLATSMAAGVDAVGFLVKAFEGLSSTVHLAFAGMEEIGGTVLASVTDALGAFVDVIFGTVQSIVDLANNVPLVSSGFDSLGVSLAGASDSIASIRTDYHDFSAGLVQDTADYRDAILASVTDSVDSYESFNQKIDAVSTSFVDLAVKISDASKQTDENAAKTKDATQKHRDFGSAITQTAAEMKKASDELAKHTDEIANDIAKQTKEAQDFLAKVTFAALDESGKIASKREDDLKKLDELVKGGFLDPASAADAAAAIYQVATEGLNNVHKKMADELKTGVENATKDPLKFLVSKLDIQPAALDGLQEGIGAAIGSLGEVLKGAAGAKDLISAGAGAFADAFIPGIGPAITGVVGQLAQGPEATKAFVKDFIKSVPDIIVAIAESIPVVVESFVDSMINDGGIVRIALAFTKIPEALFKSIGKQLGLDIGQAFNADNLAKKFGDGVKTAFSEASELTAQSIRESLQQGARALLIEFPAKVSQLFFVQLPEALRNGFAQGAAAVEQAIASIPGILGDFFTNAVPNAFSAAGTSIVNVFSTAIPEAFNAAIANLKGSISESIGNLTHDIKEAFSGVFEPFKTALSSFKFPELPKFKWPDLPTFKWPALPSFSWPSFPTFKWPSLPAFADNVLSKLGLPAFASNIFSKLKLPEFASDLLSKLQLPALDADFFKKLSLPDFSWPALPSWNWPEIPEPGWLHKLSNPAGGNQGLVPNSVPVFGKLATGGRVPEGFPNDSYPAALTSGEEVFDTGLSASLRAFLADQGSGNSDSLFGRVLAAIEHLAAGQSSGGQDQPLVINLQIGEAQLAKAMLSLNRQGFRVA